MKLKGTTLVAGCRVVDDEHIFGYLSEQGPGANLKPQEKGNSG